MNERLGLTRPAGAILFLIAGLLLVATPVATAQDFDDSADDTSARIHRLERDLRDLQQEVYRNNGGAPRASAPPVDVPPAQAAPLAQRLADMEETLQRLTGQVEELQHQNRVLTTKVERLQRALEFQQGNGPAATEPGLPPSRAPSATAPAPAPDTQWMGDGGAAPPQRTPATSEPQALAPGPSNLGTLPENTPLPIPKPQTGAATGAGTAATEGAPARTASLAPQGGGGVQAEYDAAMALLRRAQYPAAQQAFRAFADAHPTDPHAAEALYWTGDIAYSARRDFASAARAFAELLKKYGKAPRAPEGMLKLGLSLLGLSQKQEGCATLAALPVKYANAAPALIARAAAERKRAACT